MAEDPNAEFLRLFGGQAAAPAGLTDEQIRAKTGIFPGAPITPELRADTEAQEKPFTAPMMNDRPVDPLSFNVAPPSTGGPKTPVLDTLQRHYGEKYGAVGRDLIGPLMAFGTHIYSGVEPRNIFAKSPERILAEETVTRNLGPEPVDFESSQIWRGAVDWEMKQPRNAARAVEVRQQIETEQGDNPLAHLASSTGSFGQFLLNTATIGKVLPGSGPVNRIASMGTEEAVVPEIKQNAPEGSTMGERFKEGVKTGVLYELTGGLSKRVFQGAAPVSRPLLPGPDARLPLVKIEDPVIRALAEHVPQNVVLGGALAPEGEKIQGALEGGLIGGAMGAAGVGEARRPPEPARSPLEARPTPAPAEPIPSIGEQVPTPGRQVAEKVAARQEPEAHPMALGKPAPKSYPVHTPSTNQTAPLIERRTLVSKLQQIRDHIASGGKASPLISGKGSPAKGRVLGLFRRRAEDVSLKRAQDVETLVHETTHHVSKYLWKSSADRDAALAPFRSELEPLATPGHPLEEGFAEYVRTLVENPQAAHNAAPSFSQNFPKMLEARDPVLASHIAELQDNYQSWFKQGEWGRAKSVVVEPEKPSLLRPLFEDSGNIINYWDKFLFLTARPRAPVEAVVRRYAREKGLRPEQIAADKNPALEIKQAMASGARQGYFLYRGVLDFHTQKEVPGTKGFLEAIRPIKPSEKRDFETWWALKRASSLLKGGTETQKEAARTLVQEQMRVDPKNLDSLIQNVEMSFPHFTQVGKDLKVLSDGLLDYAVAGGALDAKAAAEMKKLDYAPWQRLMEAYDEIGRSGGRSMMSGQGAIKKLRGKTERPIVSPLAAMETAFAKITQAAENASARRHFFDMLQQIEGYGSIASELKQPIKGTRGELSEIKKELEAAGVDTSKIDLDQAFTLFRPDESFRADRAKRELSYIDEKGKRRTWKIHDKMLFDAIAGYDQDIGGLPYKILKETLGKFTSLKRMAIISAPGLALGANPVRDLPMRWLNTGTVPGKEAFKGLLGVAGLTKDANRLFNEAEWDGALLGTLTSQTMRQANESVKTALAGPFSPRKIGHTMREVLRRYLMISEAPPRIDAYERRLKEPLPQDVTGRAQKIRAVAEGRESSLDFSEVGRAVKPFAPFTAFMAANVQGIYKIGESAVKHPFRLAALGSGIAAASISNWLYNNSEEWKEDVWGNIPNTDKAGYWITIGGDQEGFEAARREGKAAEAAYVRDHSFKVPKPWELGFIFGTLPENLMDAWRGKVTPAEARAHIKEAAKQLAPPVVPDLLQMVWEQGTKWDEFRDRPIVPKSQEDVDPDYQYGPQTSETAKRLAWATNDAIRAVSGNDKDPGFLSPYQIDHFLNLGPVAKSGIDATDDLIRYFAGKEAPPEKASEGMRDVPFIGDIARRFTVNYPGSNSTPISDYYDTVDRLRKFKDTFDSLKKRPGLDPQELRQYVDEHRFELGMMASADRVSDALAKLRQKMNADLARRDITPEKKRELRDESLMTSIEITQKWLVAYKAAEKNQK